MYCQNPGAAGQDPPRPSPRHPVSPHSVGGVSTASLGVPPACIQCLWGHQNLPRGGTAPEAPPVPPSCPCPGGGQLPQEPHCWRQQEWGCPSLTPYLSRSQGSPSQSRGPSIPHPEGPPSPSLPCSRSLRPCPHPHPAASVSPPPSQGCLCPHPGGPPLAAPLRSPPGSPQGTAPLCGR